MDLAGSERASDRREHTGKQLAEATRCWGFPKLRGTSKGLYRGCHIHREGYIGFRVSQNKGLHSGGSP